VPGVRVGCELLILLVGGIERQVVRSDLLDEPQLRRTARPTIHPQSNRVCVAFAGLALHEDVVQLAVAGVGGQVARPDARSEVAWVVWHAHEQVVAAGDGQQQQQHWEHL
jgi:hypothetical protein